MARRYNYKWNTQNITCGKLSTLNVLNKIEVVPGDSLDGKMGVMSRFEAFKKPLMNDLIADYWLVYVPHRIVWDGWTDFITRKSDDPIPTYSDLNFMLEANHPNSEPNNALDALAYAKVYEQFFCRPEVFSERNNAASINRNSDGVPVKTSDDMSAHGLLVPYVLGDLYSAASTTDASDVNSTFNADGASVIQKLDPSIVDMSYQNQETSTSSSNTSAVTNIDLDVLYRQEAIYKEARDRARYGDGYEDLLNRWGVTVPDAMLDRAEVLCHKRDVTQITDVVVTSESGVGKTGGHGMLTTVIDCPRKLFPEHGTVLLLQSIRPQCGATPHSKSWFSQNNTIEDYFDPFLLNANLPDRELTADIQDADSGSSTVSRGFIKHFDWYRRPKGSFVHSHMINLGGGDAWLAYHTIDNDTDAESWIPDYNTYNYLFSSLANVPFDGHYVTACSSNLNIKRPIPPAGVVRN